jgi:hypothetical protein
VYLYAERAGDVLKRANHYWDRMMGESPSPANQGREEQGGQERHPEGGAEQS